MLSRGYSKNETLKKINLIIDSSDPQARRFRTRINLTFALYGNLLLEKLVFRKGDFALEMRKYKNLGGLLWQEDQDTH
jgi:hypothetical protein